MRKCNATLRLHNGHEVCFALIARPFECYSLWKAKVFQLLRVDHCVFISYASQTVQLLLSITIILFVHQLLFKCYELAWHFQAEHQCNHNYSQTAFQVPAICGRSRHQKLILDLQYGRVNARISFSFKTKLL